MSLISLQPNQLVFAGLGREIPLDDLTVETSLSRHQASDARRHKEASNILHESTCRTTLFLISDHIVCSNLFTKNERNTFLAIDASQPDPNEKAPDHSGAFRVG
jgi:hypothetical protein